MLLTCLAACGGAGSDGAADSAATPAQADVELAGHTFVSEQVTGHELVEGSTVTVSFEDGAMRIAAGCNTLFGPYDEAGGELSWQAEPGRTLMACDPALEAQDDWLVELFTTGVRIGNDDADLVLSADPVRLAFSQDDQSAPDFSARLNGPDTAQSGTVVILSLSNVGRLRDSYQLTVSPKGNGLVEPRHLTIEPGRAAKLQVKVKDTPLVVKVEGVGGGADLDELTIN